VGFRPQSGIDQQDTPASTHEQRIHAQCNPVRGCGSRPQHITYCSGTNTDAKRFTVIGHYVLGVMQSRQFQRTDTKRLRRRKDRERTEPIIGASTDSKAEAD
jgi:hypothetical protein